MPPISDHQSHAAFKVLLVGDSGAGKTYGLGSLAKAGYNLYICDFDNGLSGLAKYAEKEGCTHKINFQTFTDPPKGKKPTAFKSAMKELMNWEKTGTGINTWGESDVVVIDSLTFAGKAAFNYVLFTAGRSFDRPQIQDWGDAMNMLEGLVEILNDSSVKCNVIINSHIVFVEKEGVALTKAYPMALGTKLPPKIPTYFDNMWLVESDRRKKERNYYTQSTAMMELKNSNPTVLASMETASFADICRRAVGA